MHELTGFQRDILFVVAGLGDPHGMAVQEALEAYYDSAVQHGHLYPNLDTLADAGLIDKSTRDARSNAYSLTDAGVEEIEARREWEADVSDR
ncbi:PadR family transcriptional regulator [Halocalculus aciditolerans]|uniref:PadR family transcriptional regulator n=1 Tax=Halocalculus aciditolerans TaxID=1383812 RepID=A0A830F9G5_9EURY|nr:PadR family transcriptional regulator [Halocalculus aciditolerans]GGL53098.1 PadR family transcriptional regulator [Halocalculus aciditolerans]